MSWFNKVSEQHFSPTRFLLKSISLYIGIKIFGIRQQYLGFKKLREKDQMNALQFQQFDYNFNQQDSFILRNIIDGQNINVKQVFKDQFYVIFYGNFSLFLKIRQQIENKFKDKKVKYVYINSDKENAELIQKLGQQLKLNPKQKTFITEIDEQVQREFQQDLDFKQNTFYFIGKNGQLLLYEQIFNADYNKYLQSMAVYLNKEIDKSFTSSFDFQN